MRRGIWRVARVLCAALLVAAAGCRRADAGEGEAPALYTAVERARTGASAGLAWAAGMDVDRRGTLYVADGWAVRVFAPDGGLLRTIGRRGGGPGEFEAAISVAVLPGDSLWVFDGGLNRVTVFEPGGRRAAYTVQVGRDPAASPSRVARVRGGRMLAAVFESAYDFNRPQREGTRGGFDVVRLLNADGSLRGDSVLLLRERESLVYRNPTAVGANPFGRESFLALAGRDRLVTAWSDSLKFDVWTVDGRHLETIRPRWAPPRRPITAAERDSVVAALSDGFPAASVRRALAAHGATTWPLLREVLVDDRDRIWAAVTGARGEPVHWTAFDRRGRRVAAVDLPPGVQLRLIRGATAWAAVKDENDVPGVVTYQLAPPPRAR